LWTLPLCARAFILDQGMEPALHLVSADGDLAVATFHNVVLVHFRGQTSSAGASVIRRAFAAQKERFLFFCVIETASVPPDEAARQSFIKLFDEFGDRLALALVTIRGEGFRAAMVRIISSGILNFIRFRVRFPKHIGGSLEEAAGRAAEHAEGADAASLLSAFAELRLTSAS
jgi:hypothetical protein